MEPSREKILARVYPKSKAMLDQGLWNRVIEVGGLNSQPEAFSDTLALQADELALPPYVPELAKLEWIVHTVLTQDSDIRPRVDQLIVNPTLQLVQLGWKHLTLLFTGHETNSLPAPEPGEEFVLVWQDPKTREVRTEVASDQDLLVLKMVVEGIEPEEVAEEGGLPIGGVDIAIDGAVNRGILLRPESRIRRDPEIFPVGHNVSECFLVSPTFSIQWHITQACDLRCKHCYDRSSRSPLKLDQALRILDDLRAFCHSRYVKGHVSFTGGNPLLYPHFSELYSAASERGFTVAILGNPAPRKRIEELIDIQRPDFFQTSLEGLPEHNDAIRGPEHFQRVIEFLKVLRDLDVYSMIMLTLTEDNVDQILPLTEMLRKHTKAFFFNRLSMVGEGANLQLPSREKFAAFLEQYLEAAKSNPILGLKDNLFNIIHHNSGIELFEGCTGYGCGAAFNFAAILSDGEVHACRKFPSPIGNIFEQGLAEIYDSPIARRYRSGSSACGSCVIRPVCGGCLAIAHSHGLDIFEDRDPFCFMATSPTPS